MSRRVWIRYVLSGAIGFVSADLAIRPEPILKTIGLALAIGFLVAQAMLMARVHWIYRQRQKLLASVQTHADMEAYESLADWDDMIERWWIWRIEDFQK